MRNTSVRRGNQSACGASPQRIRGVSPHPRRLSRRF
jgi:hypothetical protein